LVWKKTLSLVRAGQLNGFFFVGPDVFCDALCITENVIKKKELEIILKKIFSQLFSQLVVESWSHGAVKYICYIVFFVVLLF
jgi:hypothetical protein